MSGKVRIWDTVNKEHILKNEFQPFAGCVKDLSWSSDNSKIAVGGEGREKFVQNIVQFLIKAHYIYSLIDSVMFSMLRPEPLLAL